MADFLIGPSNNVNGGPWAFDINAGGGTAFGISYAGTTPPANGIIVQGSGLSRDPRCLGVAVRRIVVRQRTRFQKGFHAFEADENLRWTDGDALLPPEMFAGLTGPIEFVLHIALTAQYAEGVAVARAA